MRKLSMILVMSLVLVVGLWGYSRSENRPAMDRNVGVTAGPTDDHPWGGDQDNGGDLKTSGNGVSHAKPQLQVYTGNAFMDALMNRFILHSTRVKMLLLAIPEKNVTVTPGTGTSTPAGGTSGNGAN